MPLPSPWRCGGKKGKAFKRDSQVSVSPRTEERGARMLMQEEPAVSHSRAHGVRGWARGCWFSMSDT